MPAHRERSESLAFAGDILSLANPLAVGLDQGVVWHNQPATFFLKNYPMKISNNQFNNEEVALDLHGYDTCKFTNCRFAVLGYGAFALNQCEVTNCQFTFAGPAASVFQTMGTIYHSLGDQGKNLIEGTFEQIRNTPANKQA